VSSTSHELLDVADWPKNSSTQNTPLASNASWQQQLNALALQQFQQGQMHIHSELKLQFEQSLFDAALQFTGGHRQQAAQLLGLGRNTLTRKLGSGRKSKDET
jgi:two-component system nitrogen regulation response regulator GlnG